MTSKTNTQLVIEMFEHWPDADALDAIATDDFELIIEADPETKANAGTYDRSQTLAIVRDAATRFTGTKVEIRTTTAEADRVAVEMYATSIVPGNGSGEADREFRMRAHHLFVFRDGKLACIREYGDTAYAARFFSPVEQNKRTAIALLEHWLDPDFLDSIATDDLVFVVEADPRYTSIAGTKDKEHIKESWRRSRELVGAVDIAVKGLTGEGNRVAIEAEGHTVVRGQDGAESREYVNRIHFLFEFRGAKLCRAVEYIDSAMIAAQFQDVMNHITARP